ncbi:MAG: SoxR reducing system RseC family protein [Candidatus Thiodiazotropha sp. (ex Monitilora ramsayi)]|nr:SoxR reducing system RseC family protein [Candidatus Thiodiazotropha sp. (ex Monitilora ramsayi)]
MIEETATVVGLEDGYAIVETQQQAACGSCDSAGSCSTTILSGLFKRRRNQLKVHNPIQAQPGERVVIGLKESAFLNVSFTAYLLPLLCLILFAIVFQTMADHFALQAGELPTVIGGLLGLIAGLVLFRRIAQRKVTDPSYQAVILRQADTQPVRFV